MTSNKNFSLFLSFCSLIISFINVKINILQFYFLFSLGIFFIVLAFTKPEILQPINTAWHKFGELMGGLMNPIILGLIYFGLLTPLGLFRKYILNKDDLNLRFNKNRITYWKTADNKREESQSFKDQF